MLDYHNYKNFNEINKIIVKNLHKIPADVDLIVGIPRSGLIVSSLISEYVNLPATDLFSFVNGVNNYPVNYGSLAPATEIETAKTILLVDDAVGIGLTFAEAKKLINERRNVKIITLAPFVEPKSTDKVDVYFEAWEDQFMPWSIFKRGIIEACCDIDGILTEDVPPEYDDDGEKYIEFLKNQKPKFRTGRTIHTLVTGRLEKYRNITEEWLKEHGISYCNLIMCSCKDKHERSLNDMGKFKASVFNQTQLPLFIESDFNEAKTIKNICSDRCVYCADLADYIN